MITYTRAEKEGKPATYDCGLCGHFAEDVDGAREHQAVHVAGPELLAALHGLGAHPELGDCFCINETQIKNGHAGECREARAAIAKAEPAKPEHGCPPGCGGCGCASTPHPPCGHCESHQTPESA